MRRLMLDPRQKIAVHLDAIFGSDTSNSIPLDRLEFTFSKRTGRIKNILLDNNLVATLRKDGGLALTIFGAKLLMQSSTFKQNSVVVSKDIAEFIAEGKSVFCKHVVNCGNNVRIGSDVAVLDENGNLIAVGKSVLSAKMIREFKRGVAVKVRESLKAGR
ncbi:MAG: PUA domain-containing protein [Nitrososphaerales archaeon]